MATETEIADAIQKDLGLKKGIEYARRLACSNGPLSAEYRSAWDILQSRLNMKRIQDMYQIMERGK